MDSANFQKIKEVFAEALEKPAKEREDFLREKCADDTELLAEVKSLLEANDKTEKFIEQNALGDYDKRIFDEAQIELQKLENTGQN